jgi:hypothetical protein
MGDNAGVYEELKQLKFNVEVLKKTGCSDLVQKTLISLRRTIGMIDNRSPTPNWATEKKILLILNHPTPVPNITSILIFLAIVTTYKQNAQIRIYFRDRLIYYYF